MTSHRIYKVRNISRNKRRERPPDRCHNNMLLITFVCLHKKLVLTVLIGVYLFLIDNVSLHTVCQQTVDRLHLTKSFIYDRKWMVYLFKSISEQIAASK